MRFDPRSVCRDSGIRRPPRRISSTVARGLSRKSGCLGRRVLPTGLISESLTKRLQQMARLRNLLVHVYWKIDYSQVYNVIRGNLGDLRAFAAAMAQLV